MRVNQMTATCVVINGVSFIFFSLSLNSHEQRSSASSSQFKPCVHLTSLSQRFYRDTGKQRDRETERCDFACRCSSAVAKNLSHGVFFASAGATSCNQQRREKEREKEKRRASVNFHRNCHLHHHHLTLVLAVSLVVFHQVTLKPVNRTVSVTLIL